MRLLLVEDEPDLARALAALLARHGYLVDAVSSLGTAYEAVLANTYRAVLLDRRLPDGDGLSLLPMLKTRPGTPPALVLTALDDVPERVAGLDAGAEDYLVKPFAPEELLARLRAMLRREPGRSADPGLRIGRLAYSLDHRELSLDRRIIRLGRRETALLDLLARRLNRVVLREHLEQAVYGFDDMVGPNALEAHVSRLRRRLAEADAGVTIPVIRGVGYMLRAQ